MLVIANYTRRLPSVKYFHVCAMAEIRYFIKKYRISAIAQCFDIQPAFAELDYHSYPGGKPATS